MKSIGHIGIGIAVVFLLAVCIAACAKPYHLKVNYTLPQEPVALTQSSIAIKVIDARENRMIFSAKAQKEFDQWDGTFVFSRSETDPGNDPPTSDFTGLLKKALKLRLDLVNIDVVDETPATPVLVLTLKSFFLDLKDRNWLSDFSYEAELSKDGTKTGREQVNARAERTKVMGKGGGEMLIGEIFSDAINQLNLQKLFENAGY